MKSKWGVPDLMRGIDMTVGEDFVDVAYLFLYPQAFEVAIEDDLKSNSA